MACCVTQIHDTQSTTDSLGVASHDSKQSLNFGFRT